MLTHFQPPPLVPSSSGSTRILIAVGLLILVVLVFGLVAMQLRRRLLSGDARSGPGLLLDDLRQMLRRGEISQAEFDAMRQRLAAKLASSARTLSPSDETGGLSITSAPPKDRAAQAKPGFDLTGDRLPEPKPGD